MFKKLKINKTGTYILRHKILGEFKLEILEVGNDSYYIKNPSGTMLFVNKYEFDSDYEVIDFIGPTEEGLLTNPGSPIKINSWTSSASGEDNLDYYCSLKNFKYFIV